MLIIQENTRRIAWWLIIAFLAICLFTPLGFHGAAILAFSLASIALTGIHVRTHELSFEKGRVAIPAAVLCAALLIIILASPFGFINAGKLTALVLSLSLIVFVVQVDEDERATRAFYIASVVCITAACIVYSIDPNLYQGFGGTMRGSYDLAPMLPGLPDKNRTALLVFLILCISIKKKYAIGVVLGIAFPFFYFGRQYVFMVAILAIALTVLKHRQAKQPRHAATRKSTAYRLFAALATCTVLMAAASWLWVEYVIPLGEADYKAGLNDGSNAMRFSSTVYTLARAGEQLPGFLIYGYDEMLSRELKINDGELDKLNRENTFFIDGKIRLVQPHEDVINTLVKEGLLFTICYYLMASILIARFLQSPEENAIAIAYVAGSLVLHEMLAGGMFVALLLVLSCRSRNLKATRLYAITQKRQP